MKRLVLLLLMLAVALGPALGAAEAEAETETETVYEIYDAAGLKDAANHPGARFLLMNDIDLAGEDWTPIPFSGELDGGGHGIYNLEVTRVGAEIRTTVDGNMKKYESTFAGLFSVAENANIHDLKVIGAHVEVDGETHCFAAVVAGYADNADFTNVTVDGRARLNNYAVMAGVGGLAGFGWTAVNNCQVRVELIFEDRNFDSKCEQFMGGILACGFARILDCTVEIDGYDSCHGYVHNGGLMGMYWHCGKKNFLRNARRTVTRNTVTGRIYFFEDNPDRRAYCSGDIGEPFKKKMSLNLFKNNIKGFERKELKEKKEEAKKRRKAGIKYDVVLLPETCENPEYEIRIALPSESEWGYTEHVCTTCGYTWRDQYVPGP